ncbi:MAG: hypothetical protein RH862_10725 [Leptospiraceae bacterium]
MSMTRAISLSIALLIPAFLWSEENDFESLCEARFHKVEAMAKQTFGTAKDIGLDMDSADGECAVNYDYGKKGFLYSFQAFKHRMGTDQAWEKLISDFRNLKKRFEAEIQEDGVPSNMKVDIKTHEFRASLRSLETEKSRPVQMDLICRRSEGSIACLQNQPNMDSLDNLKLESPVEWPYPEWLPLLENLP